MPNARARSPEAVNSPALIFSVAFGPNRFAGDVSEETTEGGGTSLSATVGTWSSQ